MTESSKNTTSPAAQRPGFLAFLVRAALPVGLLAAGCIAYLALSVEPEKPKRPPRKPRVIRTRVTELKVQDYQVVIKTHGVVQAYNEVSLSTEVSGQIIDINPAFEVGSYFAKGAVLVELDGRDHATAVTVAKANHLGAKTSLQLATQAHERARDLFQKGVSTEVALEQALGTRSRAKAELDSAVAQVAQAERNLERTKIRAPFDGRVRHKAVGLGQLARVGTPLGVVFAIEFAEVRLPLAGRELPFLDLPELADDPPVEVELKDAINKESKTTWKARILRTEGTLDRDSLELFAIARVDDPFGRKSGKTPLRIGQPVIGSISGRKLIDVVALPRNAVRQLDQIVLVDKTELTLTSLKIVPIWSNEEFVIVRDPLIRDGALLATTRLVYAPEGQKVEIIPDMEPPEEPVKESTTSKPSSASD